MLNLEVHAEAILRAAAMPSLEGGYWGQQMRLAILAAVRALAEDAAGAMRDRAADHARCVFDDRPRDGRNIDYQDGYDDASKHAALAIRAIQPAELWEPKP